MAHQVRFHDWAATPLGPVEAWPAELRFAVASALDNHFPTAVVWGPQLITIYNDGFQSLLGNKTGTLGQPFSAIWAETWHEIEPITRRAFDGESSFIQNFPVRIDRSGRLEQAFFTFSYSPIRGADGVVLGMVDTVVETTAAVEAHVALCEREARLRESELRSRVLVEDIAQATWEANAEGVVTTDSPSWRHYTGQSLEEWLGHGWLGAIHPDDRRFAERQWREAVADVHDVNAEFRLRSSDGGWRWTNVRAVPSLDDEGSVRKWIGMNIDIDMRKQAERRQAFMLRLSDAMRSPSDSVRLEHTAMRVLAEELAADRVFLATLEADGEGWIVRHEPMQDAAECLHRWSMTDFQRTRLSHWHAGRMSCVADSETDPALSAADRTAYAAFGARAAVGVPLLKGGRFDALLCVNHATPRVWTAAELSLTGEAAERIWAAVERLRAEETSRASEERLRRVLDAMAEGFALLDTDFRILDVNRETTRLDGRDREALVGRSHWDAFPGTQDSPVGELFRRVVRTQVPESIEHHYAWSDDRRRWLETRVYPTREGGLAAFWRDVTDRRRAGDALRRSEEKYRALFESMDEAYAVIDMLRDEAGEWADFRFVDANPAFMKHTTMPYPVGKTATELLGTPNPRWAKLYGRALDTDHPLRLEESEATLGRTFDLNIFPLDRSLDRVAVLFSDITDRKGTERAMRESEERLRRFGEASQDVLWIRDADDLQWQYLSPGFEAIYGLTREQALAGDNYRNWQDMVLDEDRAHVLDSIRRVVDGEQVVFEYRIRRPADGQLRWLRDTDFPMRDADGHVRRIGGVGQDITAMKSAEEAIAAAREHQRLLLEGMPQLVWRAVDGGRWTWSSPQWIRHTGLDDAASRGHGWLDAVHPEDREAALLAWSRADVEGLYQVEYRIRDAGSGHYHWFQTRGTPIRRADGQIVEWLGTSTDIDEQARAREYLRQAGVELERRVAERTAELQRALDTLHHEVEEHEKAEERLRQSEKLKAVGQLTGGIAHDFNNMLQGITSALALVQARLAQGRLEAAQSYIEPAQRAAARAGALTHRLLAFSRQQTLSPRSVSLEQVAFDMEDMIRRAVGPAVQVELRSTDGRWRVHCDPNQMESALLNLCINARDAMPQGGWLTIGVEDRMLAPADLAGFDGLVPGLYVMLSVTDTGSGMPPEVAKRAFEPFFTTKPAGQGTGLGLSQIYGFMRQSGGLVQIETTMGVGTTVRLGLPACEDADSGDVQGVAKNGRTLLLVEDEHDLRRMLADQLRDLGYGVLEADTAEAALRILHTGHQVDLLVTDVGLRGGINGRQLAEAARARIAGLPVIFMTGFAGDAFIRGEDVLHKPFKPAVLAMLIKEKIG